VSYQSAYDSLSPNDQPSHTIAGGPFTLNSAISTLESVAVPAFLLAGYGVAIPDTEGQLAAFAAGPEYGYNTLDGLRAAFNAKYTRLTDATKVVLFGYSGGAIGTEWAAELAPKYAPDVNKRLIGAAMGGVLVKPSTNLHYVNGSPLWGGVMPMAIVGVARSFQLDLMPYLSDYGKRVFADLQNEGIVSGLARYSGVTWAKLTKPEYRVPESVPAYVNAANKVIMGSYGTPTIPLFIGQGAKGELEGTKGNRPGIGKGDGVMVAGDVRSLARKFCSQGVQVKYRQYGQGSHASSVATWGPQAIKWVQGRFVGSTPQVNCEEIAPGNSLEPIQIVSPAAP
ncbi:MAG: triacylglycerol lipase, partial [Solirubrobacteraceae bacterium]|nr:triacylglycerol lipase [Solirubrobacteraceae bacterium]